MDGHPTYIAGWRARRTQRSRWPRFA